MLRGHDPGTSTRVVSRRRGEELHMFSTWSALGPHARGFESKGRCFPAQNRDRGESDPCSPVSAAVV
jgi:hypothetical protein